MSAYRMQNLQYLYNQNATCMLRSCDLQCFRSWYPNRNTVGIVTAAPIFSTAKEYIGKERNIYNVELQGALILEGHYGKEVANNERGSN
jgi:hypothetical protein